MVYAVCVTPYSSLHIDTWWKQAEQCLLVGKHRRLRGLCTRMLWKYLKTLSIIFGYLVVGCGA